MQLLSHAPSPHSLINTSFKELHLCFMSSDFLIVVIRRLFELSKPALMDLITIAIRVFQLVDSISKLLWTIELSKSYHSDLPTKFEGLDGELKEFQQLISHLDQVINTDNPKRSFSFRMPKIVTLAENCNLKLQQFIKRVQQGKASNERGFRSAWRIHELVQLKRQVVIAMELLITEILVYIM